MLRSSTLKPCGHRYARRHPSPLSCVPPTHFYTASALFRFLSVGRQTRELPSRPIPVFTPTTIHVLVCCCVVLVCCVVLCSLQKLTSTSTTGRANKGEELRRQTWMAKRTQEIREMTLKVRYQTLAFLLKALIALLSSDVEQAIQKEAS